MAAVTTGTGNDENDASYAVRYEIRSMGNALEGRFWAAIRTMCQNRNGVAGTSEYFRLASYHGSPGVQYCDHRIESFPSWHRIYLAQFEQALQAADRANGNDGKIGLPYWDWSVDTADGLPNSISQNFSQWPQGLFPANMAEPRLSRNSNSVIGNSITSSGVVGLANACLRNTRHFAFASTGGERLSSANLPSVETPHNYVHGIVGGPMGAVAYAAFDIVFWLHHCNVDRILSTYLDIEPDSMNDFQNTNPNLFNTPFGPTNEMTQANGQPYYPSDTFDTRRLGYVYDTLWPAPDGSLLLMAPLGIVIFPQVKISDFGSKCYQIHVFALDPKEEEKWQAPKTVDDIDFSSKNYGGSTQIFGRGEECKNCAESPPIDLRVDISKSLRALKISRHNVKLKVYCLETSGGGDNKLIPASEVEKLPAPVIEGVLFESVDDNLSETKENNQNENEVKALQRYLKHFGEYTGDIDGKYGKLTKKAVELFQKATGVLKTDGICGKNTKNAMLTFRRCENSDKSFNSADEKNDDADANANANNDVPYGGKNLVSYFIDNKSVPGYLTYKAVVSCIRKAFNTWSSALGFQVVFNNVTDADKSDIVLSWTNNDTHFAKFDGIGGMLGRGGIKISVENTDDGEKKTWKGFVMFDISERWAIGVKSKSNVTENDKIEASDMNNRKTWHRDGLQPRISLFYTAVHEIGHALGLEHSIEPKDFMSPFYDPKKMKLSENDIAQVKKVFGAN